jgi:hypothetical protein
MAVDAIRIWLSLFLAPIGGHNQIPFQRFAIQEHERSVICRFFDMRLDDSSHPACALAGTTSLGSWGNLWISSLLEKFIIRRLITIIVKSPRASFRLIISPNPIYSGGHLPTLAPPPGWKCWKTNTGYRIISTSSSAYHDWWDGSTWRY